MAAVDLSAHPGHLARRLQQAHYLLWNVMVSEETTSPQFAVLNTLVAEPGLDQRTVGERVGLDRSTMSEVISRLRAAGSSRQGARPAGRAAVPAAAHGGRHADASQAHGAHGPDEPGVPRAAVGSGAGGVLRADTAGRGRGGDAAQPCRVVGRPVAPPLGDLFRLRVGRGWLRCGVLTPSRTPPTPGPPRSSSACRPSS